MQFSRFTQRRRVPSASRKFLIDAQEGGNLRKVSAALSQVQPPMWRSTIIQNLSQVNPDLAAKITTEVLQPLANPVEYNTTFAIPSSSSQVVDGETVVDPEDADVAVETAGEVFMSTLSERVPKGGIAIAEILSKLYDGTFTDSIIELSKMPNPETSLVEMDADLGTLGQELKEALRLLHSSEQVVSGASGAAPKVSLRELVRHSSEVPDEDHKAAQEEREDVWRRAVAHRKKWVSFGLAQNKTAAGIAELVKKSGCQVVREFKGTLNEAHRAYVVSADLLSEKGKEPWSSGGQEPPSSLAEVLKFVGGQRGSTDVLMCFDGICRKNRRAIEDAILKLPASSEIFITYKKSPSQWCERKHVFSSRNTEVGYFCMPVSRTKLSMSSDRSSGSSGGQEFNGAGEDSTHFTTYTGVNLVSRSALPLITENEKKAIMKESAPATLPKKWHKYGFQGVPLYWRETKSVELWVRVLGDANVKCVFDLSPGSGALAEACMRIGAQYFGVVFEKLHLSWLSNVVDRAALKYITTNGNPLYHEDLATHLKTLFADQIEQPEAAEFSDADCSDDGA